MGALFDIHNILGNENKEKIYQNALEIKLKNENIMFEREKYVPIIYEEKLIGKYYLDFLIDKKIILELKTVPYFQSAYISQIYRYMKSLKIRLGIIVNFRPPKLEYRRLVLADKYMNIRFN